MKHLKILFLSSMVMLFTACGGGSSSDASSVIVSPPPPEPVAPSGMLTFIDIEGDVTDILAKGQNVQLSAFGIYADDSENKDITTEVQWTSSDESIATITSTGLLETHETGSVLIHATLDGIESNTLLVFIGQATLSSISITPSIVEILESDIVDFTAIGRMSDGTEYIVDSIVSWSSSNLDIATIDAEGVATGLKSGTVTISVTYDNTIPPAEATLIVTEEILESFTIRVPSTLENARSAELVATGTYDNGTSKDISDLVTWSSSDDTIASISGTTITGENEGNVTVSAELNGITNSAELEIIPDIWQDRIYIGKLIRTSCVNSYCQTTYTFTISNDSSKDLIVESYSVTNTFTSEVIDFQITSSDLEAGSSVEISRTSTDTYPNITLIFTLKEPLTNETKTFTSSLP